MSSALNCYLSTIVALANCMEEICPEAGPAYRDRLLRLPRRLGFDPTPEALEESQKVLETDIADFVKTTRAWVNAEANHATQVLEYTASAADGICQSADLHAAMLNDLAEHMETSAEVDDVPQVRTSLLRYAAGLRAYVKRKKTEDHSALAELQSRAKELEEWLSLANRSETVDPVTGLLNRAEALRRLKAHLDMGERFCFLLVKWVEASSIPPQLGRPGADQIVKQIGERLVTLVRPRDTVYEWGHGQFAVIFDRGTEEASARAHNIAQWLSGAYSAVVDGTTWKAKANVAVTVVEPVRGETVSDLIIRIDSQQAVEVS